MAHSWYDRWCCDERDCAPIAAEQVVVTPQGYRVQDAIVAFGDARVSMDRDYHVCRWPDGSIRCFYAPPMGG